MSPRWKCLLGHRWTTIRGQSTLYAVLITEQCRRCGAERTVVGGMR
jgi:hypothetical protein